MSRKLYNPKAAVLIIVPSHKVKKQKDQIYCGGGGNTLSRASKQISVCGFVLYKKTPDVLEPS